MAKSKVPSKDTQRQETIEIGGQPLNNAIFELHSAENLLRVYERNNEKADAEVLLSLIKTALAKLDYFQRKYDFEIDDDDQFYVEDMLKFAEKKAVLEATDKGV